MAPAAYKYHRADVKTAAVAANVRGFINPDIINRTDSAAMTRQPTNRSQQIVANFVAKVGITRPQAGVHPRSAKIANDIKIEPNYEIRVQTKDFRS
jgi:hypothetical protein